MHNQQFFALRMLLISDGLFFSNKIRRPFDDSTFRWTLQRRRCLIQCCSHKGQFAPGLFRVVRIFYLLILLVCMWMQFALRMQLFSDGLFFTNDVRRSFDYSTVGWTLQRSRCRIQRCCLIQSCCLSSQVLSPPHLQPGISECMG